MKRTSIGGQGVLEGVMMRSPETTAIAVRRESGEIVTQKQRSQSLSARYKISVSYTHLRRCEKRDIQADGRVCQKRQFHYHGIVRTAGDHGNERQDTGHA